MTEQERCDCGRWLHYGSSDSQRIVEMLIAELGPTVRVCVEGTGQCWRVPRHYIALHGLAAVEVPVLAKMYGWEEAS